LSIFFANYIQLKTDSISYTLNRKPYTLKRKFLFRPPCNVSITIDKNKQNYGSVSGSYLPYISPLSVEGDALPKAKLGEVIRLRSPFPSAKNISDHSVITSCRQSWVLSGSGLMRGLAERKECRKIFENKSEIWKARGGSSAVGMEVCAAGSDAVAGVRDVGSGAETFGDMEVAA
jgi:hypothetical protein